MKVEMRRLEDIIPYAANAKKHDSRQVANVAESIRQFGFVQPVVVDRGGVIVIGHCRALAAEKLGLSEVPCVCVDDLTSEQVNALRLVDNKTNESLWDLDLLAAELPELDLSAFDFEWGKLPGAEFDIGSPAACAAAVSENPLSDEAPDYQSFVEKFMPKKTTDDCYTPENIYAVVKDWAVDRYGLSGAEVLRPFYPGGDYKAVTYDENAVVIDNPPFSIISEICGWYMQNGVRFFLFAPALTLFSVGRGQLNYIGCGAGVTFDNGANISISFVTNMGNCAAMSAPDLRKKIDAANEQNLRSTCRSLPKYSYPLHVLTPAMLQYFSAHDVSFCVKTGELAFIRALDSQSSAGKTVFGFGFLISEKAAAEKAAAEKAAAEKAAAEKAAAEKAAAEKAAAEKAAAEKWQLSDREKSIIASLC